MTESTASKLRVKCVVLLPSNKTMLTQANISNKVCDAFREQLQLDSRNKIQVDSKEGVVMNEFSCLLTLVVSKSGFSFDEIIVTNCVDSHCCFMLPKPYSGRTTFTGEFYGVLLL